MEETIVKMFQFLKEKCNYCLERLLEWAAFGLGHDQGVSDGVVLCQLVQSQLGVRHIQTLLKLKIDTSLVQNFVIAEPTSFLQQI